MKSFILIGHSHTYALRAGLQELGVGDDKCTYTFVPKIEQEVLKADANADLVLEIRNQVRDLCMAALDLPDGASLAEKIAADDVSVLLSLGGNEHNILGLIRTGKQCDFVLPSHPDLWLEGATIIPLDAVYRQVARSLTYVQKIAFALSELFGGNVKVQAPPPPIGDNSYIFKNLDPYFKETYGDKIAVNDPLFRYKIYYMREMIMREYCASLNVEYVDGPSEYCVSGKYLDPLAYGEDATHANNRYGVAALRKLYPEQFGGVTDEAR